MVDIQLCQEQLLTEWCGSRLTAANHGSWFWERCPHWPLALKLLQDDSLPVFWGNMDESLVGSAMAMCCYVGDFADQSHKSQWLRDRFGIDAPVLISVRQNCGWSFNGFLASLLHEVGHAKCWHNGCVCAEHREAGVTIGQKAIAEIHADAHMLEELIGLDDPDLLFHAIYDTIAHLRTRPNGMDKDSYDIYHSAAEHTVKSDVFDRAVAYLRGLGFELQQGLNYGKMPPSARKAFWTLRGRTDFDRLGRVA